MGDSDGPIVSQNNACRAGSGGTACTAIAQPAGYIIKGVVATRLVYAADSSDPAFLDRSKDQTASLLTLQGVLLRIFEAKKDVDKDTPHAQTTSGADGTFAFSTVLKTGIEYKLIAIYKSDLWYTKEERVLVEKINIAKLPDPGATQNISLNQKNFAPNIGNYISTETESLSVPLTAADASNAVLNFSAKALLAFDTCMLKISYINQNHLADGTTKKNVNIDGNGNVTGGILCFPTSVAMLLGYYGQSPSSTEDVAQAIYSLWSNDGFPDRFANTGLNAYRFTFGDTNPDPKKHSNIWEWWLWENRAIRQAVGLTLQTDWSKYKQEMEGKDDFPAQDQWITFWGSGNIIASGSNAFVRRQISRGWPLVLGTKLTTAGHIILLRGLVLKKDGSVFKYIVNNPWGSTKDTEGHGLYYDSSTPAMDSTATFSTELYLALRQGMNLPTVTGNLAPATN